MAVKTFTTGEVLTASDTNTYLANSGLVYVTGTTIGSGVSSVTVSNCFSSTYDNYLIVANSTGSAAHSIAISLGSSTTGYYGMLIYGDSLVGTVQGANRNNAAQMNWIGGCSGANESSITRVEVFGPYAAAYTRIINGHYNDGSAYGTMQGEHRVATSYTAFTLTPNSGTLTGGTVTVYGYRKA